MSTTCSEGRRSAGSPASSASRQDAMSSSVESSGAPTLMAVPVSSATAWASCSTSEFSVAGTTCRGWAAMGPKRSRMSRFRALVTESDLARTWLARRVRMRVEV